jgi:hypothetical protein
MEQRLNANHGISELWPVLGNIIEGLNSWFGHNSIGLDRYAWWEPMQIQTADQD